MNALEVRNRRVRAAQRRIAAERQDVLATAVLNPRPTREPDPETVVVGFVNEYRDWTPGELVAGFGK